MTLEELIKSVKEERLRLQQLEDYHTQLSNLFMDMQIEMADLKKKEALFMVRKADGESVANRKVTWKATREGQRLIDLEGYSRGISKLLTSLKSRGYKLL